jgi:hypothetical protein
MIRFAAIRKRRRRAQRRRKPRIRSEDRAYEVSEAEIDESLKESLRPAKLDIADTNRIAAVSAGWPDA